MRLPDLTKTEFLDIFAGTKGDKALGKAKADFENFQAMEIGGKEGRKSLILHCRYRRSKLEHQAIIGLVDMTDNLFGIGLDISLFTGEKNSPGSEYLVPRKAILAKGAQLKPKEFQDFLSTLDKRLRIYNRDSYVNLLGLPEHSKLEEVKNIMKFFSVKEAEGLVCARFQFPLKGMDICVNKIPSKTTTKNAKSTLFYTCTIDAGYYSFGDIIPIPELSGK